MHCLPVCFWAQFKVLERLFMALHGIILRVHLSPMASAQLVKDGRVGALNNVIVCIRNSPPSRMKSFLKSVWLSILPTLMVVVPSFGLGRMGPPHWVNFYGENKFFIEWTFIGKNKFFVEWSDATLVLPILLCFSFVFFVVVVFFICLIWWVSQSHLSQGQLDLINKETVSWVRCVD